MLTQAWVDKLMSSIDPDEPSVMGAGAYEESNKRDAWTLRFIAHMVEAGIPMHFALELYHNGEYDYDEEPEASAQGEMDALDASDDGEAT